MDEGNVLVHFSFAAKVLKHFRVMNVGSFGRTKRGEV